MENIINNNVISSSDINLKENIWDLRSEDYISLNKVANVRLKSFNFKGKPERRVYGVIAQEVQEAALEDLVYNQDSGMLAVDYTSLLVLKTAMLERDLSISKETIKNLTNSLESLEKRVEELEKKND